MNLWRVDLQESVEKLNQEQKEVEDVSLTDLSLQVRPFSLEAKSEHDAHCQQNGAQEDSLDQVTMVRKEPDAFLKVHQ